MTKMSDLLDMVGKAVKLELIVDGEAATVEGTLLAASWQGLAVKTKTATRVVDIDEVVSAAPLRTSKLVRRWMRFIPSWQARQHLLDRHGLEYDLLKALLPDQAKLLHDRLNHKNLGHRHRPEGDDQDAEKE